MDGQTYCLTHSNSLSNKMDNSLLAVRGINHKYIVVGKETIDLYNTSDTRGQSRSYGLNYQKTGKELMSRDELAVMDGNKCILQLRGVRPFLSDKFDITRHKRYKELSDYDKKNAFDVEAYMKHQLKIRMKEEFDLYEVDGNDTDGTEEKDSKEQ